MNEATRTQQLECDGADHDEETRLELALHDPDRLLSDSLRVDERRRRTRRIVSVTLIAGGIVMGSTLMAVLAGWLTLAVSSTGATSSPEEALQPLVEGRIVDIRPVTKDSMVLAYLPHWNHGDVDNIAVANNDGGVRTLFGWKSVPVDLVSQEGRRVYLAVYSRETTTGPTGGEIAILPVTEKWPEKTSWQSQPKTAEADGKLATKFGEGNGWKLFDVTPIIRGSSNHGVMIKFTDEGRSGTAGQWSGYAFVSREGDGEWKNRRPQIVVVEASAPDASPSK